MRQVRAGTPLGRVWQIHHREAGMQPVRRLRADHGGIAAGGWEMNILRSIWDFIQLVCLLMALFVMAVLGAIFILILAMLLSPLWLILMLFIIFAGPVHLAKTLRNLKDSEPNQDESKDA